MGFENGNLVACLHQNTEQVIYLEGIEVLENV